MAPKEAAAKVARSDTVVQKPEFSKRQLEVIPGKGNLRDEQTSWGIVQKHPRLARSIVLRLRLNKLEGMTFEDAHQIVLLNLFDSARRWDPNEMPFSDFAWGRAKSTYKELDKGALLNSHGIKRWTAKYWEWRNNNRAEPLESFAKEIGVGLVRAKTIETAALLHTTSNNNSLSSVTDAFYTDTEQPGHSTSFSRLSEETKKEMSPDYGLDAEEIKFAKALWVCISRLPKKNKEAVCRYFCIEGSREPLTFSELAKEFGVTQGCIVSRVHRGISNMREQLSALKLIEMDEEVSASRLSDALTFIISNREGKKEWEAEFPAPPKKKAQRKRGLSHKYPTNRKRRGAFRSVEEAIALAEENRHLIDLTFQTYGLKEILSRELEIENFKEDSQDIAEVPEWARRIAFFNLYRSALYWDGTGDFDSYALENLMHAVHQIRHIVFPDEYERIREKGAHHFRKQETCPYPEPIDTEALLAAAHINAETYHHSTDAAALNPEELLIEKEKQRRLQILNFAILDLSPKQAQSIRMAYGMRDKKGEYLDEHTYVEIGKMRRTSKQAIKQQLDLAFETLARHPMAKFLRTDK